MKKLADESKVDCIIVILTTKLNCMKELSYIMSRNDRNSKKKLIIIKLDA